MRKALIWTYILDGHTPIPCEDEKKWSHWMASTDVRIRYDTFGENEVSTVFLGLNHNFSGCGEPILFETCILSGVLQGELRRYETWEAAEVGHAEIVDRIKARGPLIESTDGRAL